MQYSTGLDKIDVVTMVIESGGTGKFEMRIRIKGAVCRIDTERLN